MIKILGTYKIEYLDNRFVQIKNLISIEDAKHYSDIKNQKMDILSEIQEKLKAKKKNEKKDKDPILLAKLKDVENQLNEFPELFFVVNSPMYNAIETGVIKIDKPAGNVGEYAVNILKI